MSLPPTPHPHPTQLRSGLPVLCSTFPPAINLTYGNVIRQGYSFNASRPLPPPHVSISPFSVKIILFGNTKW